MRKERAYRGFYNDGHDGEEIHIIQHIATTPNKIWKICNDHIKKNTDIASLTI